MASLPATRKLFQRESFAFSNSEKQSKAGCGGSLLSSDTILTAAHCIISRSGRTKSLQGTLVVAGGQSLTSDNRQLRRIKTMIPHPSYSYHSQQNDLAIIKVFPISFTINSYVRPVCLPCHATELPDKTKCIVTGFGMTGYSRSSEEKIYASVETHTREYCQSQFGTSFKHGMMCAGGRRADTCRGDSGGPLVCDISGHYYIFGVTSWGKNANCQGGSPGVYTNVPNYISWIKNKI